MTDQTQTTLVTLWRENRSECQPLARVLNQAGRGELPGVGEYEVNRGYPVTDTETVLVAIREVK